jgi:hypothetical protein
MDAQEVLATARSASVPSSWFVYALRRDRVARSIAGWAIVGVVFLFVLILAMVATLPGLLQRGPFSVIATSLLLLVLAAVAFGGLGIAIYDAWRLARADAFLLVITPDDYVKAEPHRLTHVPMGAVGHITLKGVKTSRQEAAELSDQRTRRAGIVQGRTIYNPLWTAGGPPRRQAGQAPSLAFLDRRTDKIVTVATDDSFEALPALAEILRMYAREDDERTRAG